MVSAKELKVGDELKQNESKQEKEMTKKGISDMDDERCDRISDMFIDFSQLSMDSAVMNNIKLSFESGELNEEQFVGIVSIAVRDTAKNHSQPLDEDRSPEVIEKLNNQAAQNVARVMFHDVLVEGKTTVSWDEFQEYYSHAQSHLAKQIQLYEESKPSFFRYWCPSRSVFFLVIMSGMLAEEWGYSGQFTLLAIAYAMYIFGL